MNSDSYSRGKLRLRHLLEVNEAVGEEMDRQRPRFERLADQSSAARAVCAPNLFQTPELLADRLASMFTSFGRTLEPSAGLGRLYRAVRHRSDCHITMVELATDCCRELFAATEIDGNATLVQGDFLTRDGLGLFDSIIMNPPFRNGSDIRHITRAIELLAPGGRLVAVCANGPRQRAKLIPLAAEWIDLPAGSFQSEGTNVNTAIFVRDN